MCVYLCACVLNHSQLDLQVTVHFDGGDENSPMKLKTAGKCNMGIRSKYPAILEPEVDSISGFSSFLEKFLNIYLNLQIDNE